jgi:NCS2 family nucleobase:cation symporter-2
VTATHEVSELSTNDKEYTVRLALSSLRYLSIRFVFVSVYDWAQFRLCYPISSQRRIQGSLMADAICSILASVFTSMPNTTFSQNNGVIAMTKCASRRAGIATGVWLILMGIFAKIAGVISSIPDCVIGGMTIFLFANVFVSGITLFGELNLKSRRIRFISVLSLCVGVGVTVWPW